MTSGPPLATRKFCIPFYCHPVADAAAWNRLARNADLVALAVVNIDNGSGHGVDRDYVHALADHPEIPWAGYIALDYGRRCDHDVLDEVRSWIDTYGLRAVMLDTVSADPAQAFRLRALTAEVRELGAHVVIGNPGTRVDAATAAAFDVVCDHELAWPDYVAWPAAPTRAAPPLRWHLIHACPPERLHDAVDLALARGADLVWATHGTLDNPWIQIPGELLPSR